MTTLNPRNQKIARVIASEPDTPYPVMAERFCVTRGRIQQIAVAAGIRRKPAYRKKYQGSVGHTPAQDKLASFIEKGLAAGHQPSLEAMRQHMGWKHVTSVRSCLHTISGNGKLPKAFDKRVLLVHGWEAA